MRTAYVDDKASTVTIVLSRIVRGLNRRQSVYICKGWNEDRTRKRAKLRKGQTNKVNDYLALKIRGE